MNRAEIIAKVEKVVALANIKFGINLAVPEIGFYSKGRAAGWASRRGNIVKFNETLAHHNPETFYQTVIHEVAHLVTWAVFPNAKQNHGPEFKHVDTLLGGRGTRCHSYDTSVSKVKKTYTRYVCKCNCTTHHVTAKVASRASSYHCRKCKSKLSFTGNTVIVNK